MDKALIKQHVEWRDLIHLTRTEKLIENTLFIPWLLASILAAYVQWYILAIPLVAFYLLAALRQAHNGYHNALGVNSFLTGLTLFFNSGFMLASLHAIKFNHLKHHKHGLDHEDYETHVAQMKWWQVLLYGIPHWIHLHKTALLEGNSKTRKIVCLELVFTGLVISIALFENSHLLLLHIIAMFLGQLLIPFFTIWIVHQGCDKHSVAHTTRNRFINFFTMNMLMHYEHHLFPAVPAIKLKELARRIDKVTPQTP